MVFTTNVTFNQKTVISLSIPNDQIELWWPNGYGDQPLYELIMNSNNQYMDSRLIGFRTVELIQHNYTVGINVHHSIFESILDRYLSKEVIGFRPMHFKNE